MNTNKNCKFILKSSFIFFINNEQASVLQTFTNK